MSSDCKQYSCILIDRPAPGIERITLNRPDKRNALNNALRSELFEALESADRDPNIAVMILRGAGQCFCSGYDLSADLGSNPPYHTAGGAGMWPRHVTEGCFRIWDLAKPVIAQVHGWCLAGGSELAASCDLVYVAEDARIGYPAVRAISPPDNQFFPWLVGMRRAMEMMLTGDPVSGTAAVQYGFANRAFALDELERNVLEIAERIARIPPELQQINKRAVHRQMEAMGMRTGIRAGTELQALATYSEATRAHLEDLKADVTDALTKRDEKFGDYRTADKR
jgi:enoyl-CoA hydratase